MSDKQEKLLENINHPDDLKKLPLNQLPLLSEELRQFIINEVSKNPGHLAANLGTVELTIALHYVYNTPYDLLVWDVGHQAYGHKILTGRRDLFSTNRKFKGISGFPSMKESIYDAFGAGHSSISISAALGLAVAAKYNGEPERKVVAIIGDGSLTGGIAFEGLNNAGALNTDILVILNDNNIAIDANVGAIKDYLLDISTSYTYNKLKKDVWNFLGRFTRFTINPRIIIQRIENSIKHMLLKDSNLFEAFNFRYFGPVDGHDVIHLTKVLNQLRNIPGPKLLHCITVKGKGYQHAENNQTQFHAPGKFDKDTGEIIVNTKENQPPKYQDVFGETIIELAQKNKKIVAITPAMPTGCSLNMMMEKMPDRTFDVGIAEQHAVTFSAGLAAQGLIPFCNIYSSFLQRSYDQIIHDVALQNLHVVLCIDRAGLVGEDGPTHHGAFDLAYLNCIPNIIISAPMNEEELRNLMYTAQSEQLKPFAIRYPKGPGVMPDWKKPFVKIPIGKARQISQGNDIAILSIGHPGNFVIQAANILKSQGITIDHYDMRFLKPIDEQTLHDVFKKHKKIITVEDGTINGGLGSAVINFMADNNYSAQVKRLGIPDKFIEQGTQEQLYALCGFDKDGIINVVKSMIETKILSKVV